MSASEALNADGANDELIPPSEKFVAATDMAMMLTLMLVLAIGWRRRRARRKSPDSPVPTP